MAPIAPRAIKEVACEESPKIYPSLRLPFVRLQTYFSLAIYLFTYSSSPWFFLLIVYGLWLVQKPLSTLITRTRAIIMPSSSKSSHSVGATNLEQESTVTAWRREMSPISLRIFDSGSLLCTIASDDVWQDRKILRKLAAYIIEDINVTDELLDSFRKLNR